MKYPELIINTDGGSRGNPGPAAIGVYAHTDTNTVFELSKAIGITTNNVAEYTAVWEALNHVLENTITIDKISFILDSELVVKQLEGVYKIRDSKLIELYQKIKLQIQTLHSQNLTHQVNFTHVRRHLNKAADILVNRALDNLN